MKIALFNVNGVISPVKRGKILSKLKKAGAETHLTDADYSKLNKMGFKEVYFSSYKSIRKRGVAILVSKKVNYEHTSEIKERRKIYNDNR